MDYPISFNNTRVYSVPDTRFTRYGFAPSRPTTVLKPACPITPVNMLPYQVANSGVPYGYTLVPQQVLGPGQRLVPVAGRRNVFSLIDVDDEEEDYAPPPPRPRSRILDDLESPEIDEFSATTRQIRKDADSILQRLGTTRPTRASQFWRTYDYDTKSLTPKYLAPPPDRTSLRPTSPTLDEEPDPFLQSLRPGRHRVGALGSRHLTSSIGTERIFTPTSLTAHRVHSLYRELDEPLYAPPELKTFDYTACLRRDREVAAEKVRGDVTTRAVLSEPSAGLAEAREKRSSVRRERLGYDPNSVRSNISIRAQYAAMRAAAGRSTIRPPSTYTPSSAYSGLASTASAPANNTSAPPPAPPAPSATSAPPSAATEDTPAETA